VRLKVTLTTKQLVAAPLIDGWLVKATNYCLTFGDIQLETTALKMALGV
jgi:hypothetical protein